jgi:ubiquinone/menaquinone biosynthesis C-methylase UbiE
MSLEMIKRNKRLEGIFNKVAENYDSIGPNYFSYMGEKLIEYTKVSEDSILLDVACGKGASLFPAAHIIGEKGQVIGIDFSQEMINETQALISEQDNCNIKLIQMDAEKLDFQANSFDNVVCGLAITFFTDSLKAMDEIYRVLKDGCKFGLSTWKNREKEGALGKAYAKAFPEIQNKNTKNMPNRPNFGSVEGIEKLFKNAGFKNIEIFVEKKTFYYRDEEEWWQEQWTNATREFFEHIESIGPDALSKFKESAFIEIINYKDANGIRFDAEVLFSFGYK